LAILDRHIAYDHIAFFDISFDAGVAYEALLPVYDPLSRVDTRAHG
jgi:hypothetical protein